MHFSRQNWSGKETMVQVGDFTESPGPYPTDKASTYSRCSQVDDLLRQVVEPQEEVERVCIIAVLRGS